MYVYVEGVGGLGNILFQLASAIWYAETYGMEIKLIPSDILFRGTSNAHGRHKSTLGYDKTIFKQFMHGTPSDDIFTVQNHYTSNRIVPHTDIKIWGYCQNLDLFKEVLHSIPRYLSFEDIPEKYGDLSNAICIGVRVGKDFAHMKRITQDSYVHALDLLTSRGVDTSNIVVIADVDSYWTNTKYRVTHVVEEDVIQFKIGMACKHFILSESTFHLWIAYLGNDREKTVICFNDTDITNRGLAMDSWIRIDP